MEENALIEYVTRQRWYGAKSKTVSHSEVLDTITIRQAEPELSLALVEMRYDTGAHDIYQLLLAGASDGGTFDGLAEDAEIAREIVSAMRTGLTLQGSEGVAEFRPADDFSALGRELGAPRLVSSEQSNSSIVFDDALILKVFRRLEPGINPELEMLRFLTEHGFRSIPALGGWYAYSGGPLTATLGLLQQYVAGAIGAEPFHAVFIRGKENVRRRACLDLPRQHARRGEIEDNFVAGTLLIIRRDLFE